MTIITSYPGVYVSEDASPGFSIAGSATAVPAFALRSADNEGAPDSEITPFNTWSEVATLFNDANINYFNRHYYKSLYTWFMGGGGKCYLVQADKIEKAVTQYNDITLLVAAGSEGDIYGQFTALTNRGYPIFGLFDGPVNSPGAISDNVMNAYPDSPYGAAFYPWCKSGSLINFIAPSVIAAVSIAQTDRNRGVWKAPANQPINGITPIFPVSDELQEKFSGEKPLNMIRSFPETGTVIWGARTLENSDNWRFIPVRRLFNMVEKDIKAALSRMVFEPNSQPTWQRIKTAIDNYLRRLWEQGALMGEKPEEAWFVQIGKGITMTEEDIRQRQIILKIGLAAVRPAVFIHVKFTQEVAQ